MPKALRSGPHDDVGLDWERLSDGRVWRLKRGQHFQVDMDALKRAAKVAAARLNKVACVTVERRDRIRSWDEYAWVQFVDHAVQVGSPCPCGSIELIRTHPQYGRCPACGSHLKLTSPQEEEQFASEGAVTTGGEAAANESAMRAKVPDRARRPAKHDERFALEDYSAVVMVAGYRKANRERHYGRAIDPLGTPVLLWVQRTLPGPAANAGPARPDPPLVHRWPTPAFGGLIDLDLMREVGADEAMRQGSFSSSHDALDRQGRRRLHSFSKVSLVCREELPRRERLYGLAVDDNGDPCLLYVDYPLLEGARVADPDDSTVELHYAYRWPVKPFGPAIALQRQEPVDRAE